MVQMETGPATDSPQNSYTAAEQENAPGGASQTAEQNIAKEQIAEHTGSILNTTAQPVNDVSVTTDGTAVSTGEAGGSIADAAVQVGQQARDVTMQMLAGVDISDQKKQEIASLAEQLAKYVARAQESNIDVNLDTNKDELEEIDKKMSEALEMLEAELADVRERQRQLTEGEAEPISATERFRLEHQEEQVDQLLEQLNDLQERFLVAQEDMVMREALQQGTESNAALLGMIQNEYAQYLPQQDDMFGAIDAGMAIAAEFAEQGEEIAREEKARIDALKASIEAAHPELNLGQADDTAIEVFAKLADLVREQREEALTLAV